MRVRRDLLFLTLVLLSLLAMSSEVLAAKSVASPDFVEDDDPSGANPQNRERLSPPAPQRERVETIDLVEPPPASPTAKASTEYFYTFRQALSASFGQEKSQIERNGTGSPLIVRAQYSITKLNRLSFEVTADLMSNGTGALYLDRRFWLFRSKFRPYASAGAGILVNPSDRLAVLVNFPNYRAHGALGIELLISRAQSLRANFDLTVSPLGFSSAATVGYVWAW